MPSLTAIGLDGTPRGWVAAVLAPGKPPRLLALPHLTDLLDHPDLPGPGSLIAGIDMPIGLLDMAVRGGRECDRAARRLLGRRAASVFSPPARPALAQNDYRAAITANGLGLSKQCFHIFPKLREVDAFITPRRQQWLFETHPEVSFALMTRGTPCVHNKKTPQGRAERVERLVDQEFARADIEPWLTPGRLRELSARTDDVLDALACAWSAARIARNEAVTLPDHPPLDVRGLRMEIWG